MEKQTAVTAKSDSIVIEQPDMRMTIAHRHGVGGSDEGLTGLTVTIQTNATLSYVGNTTAHSVPRGSRAQVNLASPLFFGRAGMSSL